MEPPRRFVKWVLAAVGRPTWQYRAFVPVALSERDGRRRRKSSEIGQFTPRLLGSKAYPYK